jgi:hypothetical protein
VERDECDVEHDHALWMLTLEGVLGGIERRYVSR